MSVAPDKEQASETETPELSAGPEVDLSGSRQAAVQPEVRPLLEVYGSPRNISEIGSPIAHSGRERVRYYFYPTWRSQLLNLIWFGLTSILSIVASQNGPSWLVVRGSIFSFGSTTVYLDVPILVLIPGFVLSRVFIAVYNAKYIIDDGGVEAQIGLVSLNLRQPRLRWEDIRGSEPQQTIWERILGIGTVLVGSAMTQDVEIVMNGVPSPKTIQLLIQNERERRMQELRNIGGIDRFKSVQTD